MSRVAEKEVFKFNELSDEVQEKVIEKYYDWNVSYDWWDTVYDDTKEIASLMGIDIKDISFSGFYSQGDGACFIGHYEYKKESVKNVKSYAPTDTELHEIVENLYLEQKKHFYAIYATIESTGRYFNQSIDVEKDQAYDFEGNYDGSVIKQLLNEFAGWIYNRLEKEFEYLTSEEAIKESIEANEMEFEIDGTIY